jgi:hypothetical protein
MKGPAADATDAPQPWRLIVQPCDEDDFCLLFDITGAPLEWNWQGKTDVLEEKPVPVPLCPPQIPMHDPEFNPGLCGERPATNRLSHGTAKCLFKMSFYVRVLSFVEIFWAE